MMVGNRSTTPAQLAKHDDVDDELKTAQLEKFDRAINEVMEHC